MPLPADEKPTNSTLILNTSEQPVPVQIVSGGTSPGGDQTVLEDISNRLGDTDINGISIPSGGTGLRGWLSAIWDAINYRLPSVLVGDRFKVDGSGVTQPVSLAFIPLASNAATDTVLQQVRDAIKAQLDIASTIWTDNSGAFYVRRDSVNEGTGVITVAFTDPSGNTVTPGAGLRPLASTDKDTITDFYDVLTSDTGYSIGDLLSRVAILDVNSGTPSVTVIWLNLTLGTILSSSPTPANIERANENVGARQVGSWTFSNSSLTSIDSKLPSNLTVISSRLLVNTLAAYNQFAAETTLTAPGFTSSLDVSLYRRITCQYTVAAINTNVTVRVEGSGDGTGFFHLSPTDTDTTINANGVYAFILKDIVLHRIRFKFVGETGGTTATIAVRFIVG